LPAGIVIASWKSFQMMLHTCFPAPSTRHIRRLTAVISLRYTATAADSPSAGGTRLTASQQQLRAEFVRQEAVREAAVDASQLTAAEQLICESHAAAVARFHFTYDDPATGLRVMTRYRHYLRGSCCGNACRHCIYAHENVADAEVKARRFFNTAFWIDLPPAKSETSGR
jgi:hypothetical protein